MYKRYQVFVSSTYEDLQEERKEVMQALLELNCIPAGMELFPASNEDQWSLIKRVIDDSDYYIVIIGGRYGSTNDKGMSYTEMEYRYALDIGKPIMGFLHNCPEEIESVFTEKTQEGRRKLEAFRDLVKKKTVRFWTNPGELVSVVSLSLVNLQKQFPSVGWIRMEKSHAVTFWKEKLDAAKEFTRKARSDSKRSGILIEVAAQHPLEPDGTPGVEFARRLDMGYDLYCRYKAENIRCKLYVPGSLHKFNGVEDKVPLSEAGRKYLIEKEVPSEDIYGEDQNVKYRGRDGVYNSADECFVASQIWKDEGFSELFCVCSPVQSMRKTAHYIAFGVFPSVFTCPSLELFHDYVYEMFTALPNVLYEDHDLDPKKSKLAREHREDRQPDFAILTND